MRGFTFPPCLPDMVVCAEDDLDAEAGGDQHAENADSARLNYMNDPWRVRMDERDLPSGSNSSTVKTHDA